MRRVTVIVVFATVVSIVAFGSYWLGQVRASNMLAPPRSTDTPASTARLDGDEKLTRAVGGLERRMAAMELRQAFEAAPQQEPPASRPPASEPQAFDPAKEAEKRLASANAIESTLKTEPRDKSWASSTEGELQTAVDTAIKDGARFSTKTVKCLTSICEMVLFAPTPDDLGAIDLQLGPHITGMGSIDIAPPQTGADGRATVTCRLFRQGYPRPDQGIL